MARKLLKKPLKKKKYVTAVQPRAATMSEVASGAADKADSADMPSSYGQRAEKIAKQSTTEFESGLKYKQRVMDTWLEIERTYNLEKAPSIQPGHYDYPLPVLSGFVDGFHSKIDDEPYVDYEALTNADKPRAKKVAAAWRFYSDPEHADWAGEDRAGKKMAIMTGRAIFLTYCESDPEFAHYFSLVDSYDYVAEALAGGNLKDHRCGYMDNLFRSKWELMNSPHYDEVQVQKLISAQTDKSTKRNALLYRQKINRLISVGLDPNSYNDYSGDQLFRLTQGFTTFEGQMYWVTIDMSTGIWLRCDPLKEVFESGKHPFVSWAPHHDKFNFWSKAPAADLLPVCRGIRDLFNEGMYNIKKRNAGQRAYDPEMFDEPELLEWRPDGLVPATTSPGKPLGSGIYEFKTEDNTVITVNLITFLDNFVGQKTGITPGANGQAQKDVKVGVYYGDLQQVADRLGLTNRYYVDCWRQAGNLFAWGIWEHFPAKMMVKVVGENGGDWEELKKEDTEPEFACVPKSGKAELEASAVKQKQKDEALAGIMLDPRYAAFINPITAIQHRLRSANWEEEDIKQIMDVQNVGDETSLINASQAIQDLLEGKEPRVYYKATTAFLRKVKDYFDENELDKPTEKKFVAYFTKMVPIVADNMARRAMLGGPKAMLPPNMMPQGPQVNSGPTPGTPGGTAAASQVSTDMNAPATPAVA